MVRSTFIITCLIAFSIRNIVCAEVLISDDFFYNQPTQVLGAGGGFQDQEYGGGQNGSKGMWTDLWVSSGNAIITGPDIVDRANEFPNLGPSDVHRGLTQGGLSSQILQRGYEFFGLGPIRPIYFGVSTRTVADDVSPNTMMVIHQAIGNNGQIGIGLADGGFQAQLGNQIGVNPAFTSDMEFHRLIGKLEVNANGDEDRLTTWLDAVSEQGGASRIEITSQFIDNNNDLSGLLQLIGDADRTLWDDVAIGTSFESVANVSVPRLDLKIDPLSGSVSLANNSGVDMTLNYLELLSESGSLDNDGWSGIGGKLPGDGMWQANPGVVDLANRLVESNFLGGNTLANSAAVNLGTAFTSGGTRDIIARVGTTDGLLNLVSVDYDEVNNLLGDFNRDGILDAKDLDALTAKIGTNDPDFDLNGNGIVNLRDHRIWVKDLKFTWFGDANLDGQFNSSDLVAVFQVGEYEDGVLRNSTWGEGDWNGDREFDSGDLVIAFQDGGYQQGRRVTSSVPEPCSMVLLLLGIALITKRRCA